MSVQPEDFRSLIELFEKNIVRTWAERSDDWTSRPKLARLAAESCAADLFASIMRSQHSNSQPVVGENFDTTKEES